VPQFTARTESNHPLAPEVPLLFPLFDKDRVTSRLLFLTTPPPMSLSSDAPLEVLRDYIIPIALSDHIGKAVIVSGLFLVCYDWGMLCCCLRQGRLILTHLPSDIFRKRGTRGELWECGTLVIMATW